MLKFVSILLLLLFISSITCISNSTFELMKKGISPFNHAGNKFFNLIRGDGDPSLIKLKEFQNLSLSLGSVKKVTSSYLSHSILFVIGITFAVFLPIIGFIFCLCRCCDRCGGRVKQMDPKNVKCKKVVYSICLIILTITMIFAVIITLFNNQLVHESLVNPDQSISIFLNVKSQSDKIKSNLETIKSEVFQSEPTQIDNEQLQSTYKELEGAIRKFFKNFMNASEVLNLIEQSKTIKQAVNRNEIDQNWTYLINFNQNLKNISTYLDSIKDIISKKLANCTTLDCADAKNKTDSLNVRPIDDSKINQTIELLSNLNSINFHERLDKIIFPDLKLILDNKINYIKDKINNRSSTDNIKKILIQVIDRILELWNIVIQNIPSPFKNDSNEYRNFHSTRNHEQIRYYIYIGISLGIVLIIIFYLVGLLYGNCGARPKENAKCFNRGVGANFLMMSVTLTFLLSSIVMIVVLANILTASVVQTDFCRYIKVPPKENSPQAYKLLDRYLQLILKLTGNISNASDGLMEALFNKCENENFYLAFQKINKNYSIEYLQSLINTIYNMIVSSLTNQFNMTKYISSDPFANISTAYEWVNFISLSMKNDVLKTYLENLKTSLNLTSEGSSIESLNTSVTTIRSDMHMIFRRLNNIHKQYIKWKNYAEISNNKLVIIIELQSPIILKSIEKGLLSALSLLFDTMFKKVSCSHLRTNVIEMFKAICENVIDPWNGCWYGLGIFLLLVIPAMVFACLLVGLYRRILKFYPDREEPDYENYISFYARADGNVLKKNTNQTKPHKGYKPIPLK